MILGVVGIGTVGRAIAQAFSDIGHHVTYHDTKHYDTQLKDVLVSEIVFVCVPTPTVGDECDTSTVQSVVQELDTLEYTGIIAIKSTVIPGTTHRLQQQFPKLKICCVPEFLRGEHAYADFAKKYDVMIVGTEDTEVYDKICQAHMLIPHDTIQTTPTEAEFCKYFSNVYNALRVTFANDMYDVCEAMGVDYDNVYRAVSGRPTIQPDYLKCFADNRGYNGHCLPKDVHAFRNLVNKLNLTDLKLFDAIEHDNELHLSKKIDRNKKTPYN